MSCDHLYYYVIVLSYCQAIDQVTVIVGRRSSSEMCRVITCSEIPDNDISVPVPAPPTQDQRTDDKARIHLQTPKWSHYFLGVVALMNTDHSIPPFEAVINTSVPLGGGLSSSAALEVATCLFIEALCVYYNIKLPIIGTPQVWMVYQCN